MAFGSQAALLISIIYQPQPKGDYSISKQISKSFEMNRRKVVIVLCFDSFSRALIHLRGYTVPVYPDSGQMQLGELPFNSARREMYEELGAKPGINYLGVIKLSNEAKSVHMFHANLKQ